MLPHDYAGQDCSLARSLELIGERWTLLIIRDGFYGVHRFSDFLAHLGIPRGVLAARLGTLVEAGLFERRQYSEQPVRYEYHLTERGRALWPVLYSIASWGDRYLSPQGGPRVFEHTPCKARLDPHLRCTKCGELVDADEVTTRVRPSHRPGPDADDVTRALAKPRRLLVPLRTG